MQSVNGNYGSDPAGGMQTGSQPSQPEQQSVDHFRQLMDKHLAATKDHHAGMMDALNLQQNHLLRVTNSAFAESTKASSVRHVSAPVLVSQLPLTPEAAQNLALQVTNGPLAGLLVQASWHGSTLQLGMNSQDKELHKRLMKHADQLSQTLTDIFGLPVTLEIPSA